MLLSSCSSFNSNNGKVKHNNSNLIKDKNVNKVITLTSLSTDIVSALSRDKLVAIPGSSLFKGKIEYQELPRISQGRTPPNLEKIVSLKPDLVIGTNGFHDKILDKLKDINIQTVSYELNDWNSLENTINQISTKLGTNNLETSNEIINTNLRECVVIR